VSKTPEFSTQISSGLTKISSKIPLWSFYNLMNCILEELKASENAHSCIRGPNHTQLVFRNSNSCFIYKNHTAVSVVRCTQLFQRWIETAEPYTAVSVWLPLLLLLFVVTGSSLILEHVDSRLFKLACLASTLWTFWLDAACCIWVPSTPWRKALTTRIAWSVVFLE